MVKLINIQLELETDRTSQLTREFIRTAMENETGIKLRNMKIVEARQPIPDELMDAFGKALDWIAELVADDPSELQKRNNERWQEVQPFYTKYTKG